MPFKQFASALSKATDKQAFGYGNCLKKYPDEVHIVVSDKENSKNNILSRTKKFFKYREQPGILMLDYDPSEYGSTLTADELMEILFDIDPGIEKAARVVRGSVSAGVHLTGKKPKTNKGFHIYIPVKDASGIPKYGKLLFDHLWLKGHGYIALSANGGLLVRSPIDAAVFSGERLDFVGKPIILSDGLEYTEPHVSYVQGAYFDTSELPGLDGKQSATLKTLIAEAKKAIKPGSEQKKLEFKKNKIDEIVQETGIPCKEAADLVTKIFAGKCIKLWGDWILEFSDGDISVANLLEDHEKYDGRALADPIEGKGYGKTTAKFWWNDGKPIIRSFAHGEDKIYNLFTHEPKRYIEGIEPHFSAPNHISRDEACEKMAQAARQWLKNPKGHFAISAPAGIGKTRIVLEHVASAATKKFIEYYVPTHQLANEVMDTLLKINPKLKVTVIRGRTHVDKNHAGSIAPCKKSDLIQSIQDYGYNIYESVCQDCKHFYNCEYLDQFTDDIQIRIFTHKYLQLGRGLDKKIPDMAIIDEGFFTGMINNRVTTLGTIENYIGNKKLTDVICESLSSKRPVLAKLRKTFGDDVISELDCAIKQVLPSLPEVTAKTDAAKIKQKLGHGLKERQILAVMFEQLKTEIQAFPARKHSITVRLVNDKVEIACRHELDRFKKVSGESIAYVPVLCIDADFSQKVAKVFLPGIKRTKLSVGRNAYITQIYSTTNAKSRFTPRKNAAKGGRESDAAKTHIKNVQGIIDNVCSDYGKALIVGYQDLVGNEKTGIKSKVVLPKGSESVHFGALRGLNKFKDLNTAIIIGRNQLPLDVLESQAAALWWDSPNELVFTGKVSFQQRGYRLRDTDKKLGVLVMVCADDRAQLLQELQRESESLQAIDRLRLIHNDEIKNVFLLSNVPLDITVDSLVSFKELKNWKTSIEKALMRETNGVLLLGSDYLVKNYPDLFSNLSMVKNKVGAAGLARKMEDIKRSASSLVFNKKEYNLVSFRVKGEKGNNRKALVPRKMLYVVIKKHLKDYFKKDIEIFESTITRRGLEDMKPIVSDFDDIADRCSRLPQYYDSSYDVWYVKIDDDEE
ncbi:hypothetical protein [Methylobacter svalbardensis]|uniref:hypothetical protein n=1 Tax=Methylobacter svalbardensis TaxID=3080016 RepID=UPI0030EDAF2A